MTPEGKERSSLNSLKHGLTAVRVTLHGENQAEWQALRESYMNALRPVGAVEAELVESIASDAWRLRRAAAAEAGAIRRTIQRRRHDSEAGIADNGDGESEQDDIGDAFVDLDVRGFLTKALPATKDA